MTNVIISVKRKLLILLGKIDQRDVIKALFAGFVLTVICSFLPFFSECEDISNNVLRLHVMANSDSPQDQAVKLKVRDAVLTEAFKWYDGADDFQQANTAVCTHLGSIRKAAENELAQQGIDDVISVMVTEMYFPIREYEDFSLPAGNYRTLRINIGNGEGKNWWCMVYPSLCLPVEEGIDELEGLAKEEADIIKNPGEYTVKLKIVEWYEELRRLFS